MHSPGKIIETLLAFVASEAEISGPRNPPPITANSVPRDDECQARRKSVSVRR
jgi:hypothetical protein